MSSTFSRTATSTFTIVHARHLASKVAADGVPSFLLPKVTVETPRISRCFLRRKA
jgi:hypothetical protein